MIECNGKALGIRRNLEEALRHLRHRDKPRLLWIDAICINQDDRAEKADQVPLMRNIYSRAERTLVWLGQPGDKYDRRPSAALRISLKLGLPVLATVLDASKRPSVTVLDRKTGISSKMFPFSSQFYLSLISILQRPWFRRAWVIQEVAVSRRVTLVWDQCEYDWDEFVQALKVMSSIRFPLAFLASPQHVAAIADERLRYQKGPTSLLGAVMRHQRTLATDQRDKVFSFVGLAGESGRSINVNYTTPASSVYRHTAAKLIEQDGSLDILSQPPSPQKSGITGLPSWVPDWSKPTQHDMNYTWKYGPVSLAEAETRDVNLPGSRFAAAKSTKHALRCLPDAHTLSIQGFILDNITQTGPNFEGIYLPSGVRTYREFSRGWMDTMRSFFKARETIRSWQELVGLPAAQVYVTGESMEDSFWETVCVGQYRDDQMHTAARLYDRPVLFPWMQLSKMSTRFNFLGFPYGTHLLFKYVIFRKPVLEFELQARQTLNRRMVKTLGGYIGLASCHVVTGDAVALCEGSSVPLVLRKVENLNSWKVVGDVYLHGVMQGQAFDETKCREIVLV